MPNNRFYFKQFSVCQDGAAMKVGTDGVLLGAWAGLKGDEERVLDIGAGTGLLALMAAQRAPRAQVDAVEIDPGAVDQARVNFEHSPWGDRLHIHHTAIQDFALGASQSYDHILSNPPFFVDSLKTPNASRTTARHNDTLPFGRLIDSVLGLLAPAGKFSVIYPVEEALRFREAASATGLFCGRKTNVRGRGDRPVRRVLMEFSLGASGDLEEELVIETERHEYTEEYRRLTRDFYLKF